MERLISFICILSVGLCVFGYDWNYEWGPPTYVNLDGFYWNSSQAMEPFLDRTKPYLYWNTRNEGDNVTLYWGGLFSTNGTYYVITIGDLKGFINLPPPHLDAVPAMDKNNNFYWVSTRDYPANPQNLMTGEFDYTLGGSNNVFHVPGSFYVEDEPCCWITMDQEINEDGSLLFYVNAFFPYPPGQLPEFSNISVAIRNPDDGTWMEHPRAKEIMASVNNVVDPKQLRYSPATLGPDSLELYFTVRIPNDPQISGIFVAKRTSKEEPFGPPARIYSITQDMEKFMEPEAPTISADGKLLMFDRLDCEDKYGCIRTNIYSMARMPITPTPTPPIPTTQTLDR